jgi:hypothetical protein
MESVALKVETVAELDCLLQALTVRRNVLNYKLEQLTGVLEIGPVVALTKVDEKARQKTLAEIDLVDQLLGRLNWDTAAAELETA